MKRLLLILTLICCCVLTLGSCGAKEAQIPDGYQVYNNGDISFAYPETWTMTDGSTVILVSETGMGNNITVVYEAKNAIYSTITAEEFQAQMGAVLAAMGMTITDCTVAQTENEIGTAMTKIEFTSTVANMEMGQTMYIVNVGERTYTVTVTENTPDDALVENVFNTLTIELE